MKSRHYELTDALIQDGYLKTPEIIESFERIDRADFIPADQRAHAHCNTPLAIGSNQVASQPLLIAFMLELLQPKKGERILEIGAGSGWQTAILADIVSGSDAPDGDESIRGSVVGVERISELCEFAESNLERYGFVGKGAASIVCGDGSKGYKHDAPYDKIVSSACLSEDVPQVWKRQLKIGGRIVAPIGSNVVVIDKLSRTTYIRKEFFGFSFSPLVASS